MNIDDKILNQVEKLAKLTVSEAEKSLTIKKITGVLDALDKVNMDDIADLEPLYHPLEIAQIMRADNENPNIDRASLQANAPQTERGLFLVPKVIE